MARYTQLEVTDIREIICQYDLTLVDFVPIDGGASNSSYCLQTDYGNYVLTVFDDKTRDYVTQLGQLLLQLARAEFPTTRLSLPLTQHTLPMHKNKPIMLKKFIAGQTPTTLNETMIRQIGVALAVLHQIPAPDFLPTQHAYGLELFTTVIGQNVHPPFESWMSEQHSYLVQNIPLDLPRALIHGDCFADNVLFEGERFKAIIDFEEACQYYRVFDLGMGIVGLCTQGSCVDLVKARALLNGYLQGQQLSESEKNALQLFVEYAAIATGYWRFWKYYIHAPQTEMADKPFEMKRLVETIKGIPKARFLETLFGNA
ncbi:MAG: homoserine kinase type II [Cellvibrionaceae bacterium]|jgi:homoserine kinase type II